jgi:hypothetical protein
MKNALIISSCLICLLFGCSSSKDSTSKNIPEPGAKVYIELNNGAEFNGELLSVRNDVMFVCERYFAREKDLTDSAYTIYMIKNYDIKLIELSEGNNALYGIIFGGLMGGAIGAAVYKGEDKKEDPKPDEWHFDIGPNFDQLTGCCIGSLIGALAGGAIGYSVKDYEVVYERADPKLYDFTQLNVYARYKEEPEYLKKIERKNVK